MDGRLSRWRSSRALETGGIKANGENNQTKKEIKNDRKQIVGSANERPSGAQ